MPPPVKVWPHYTARMRRASVLVPMLWWAAGVEAGQDAAAIPTFARDVAPIIAARCTPCHRDGGDAPFSLTTADQVRRRAATIAAATRARFMPPWKPEPGFGDFHGARRLTDDEVALIGRWASAGAPAGDGIAAVPVTSPSEWPLGEPDILLQLPAFMLRADGADVFRNFVIPVPIASARYVRGWHFRPRNTAVHHANVRVDATPNSRRLDLADPEPGYSGVILRSADFPDGHFLGWTPGQSPAVLTDAAAWRIEPSSDLVVQLHLRPTGKPEAIAPVIGLYFGDRAPALAPVMVRLGRQALDIPAGAAAHRVTDSFELPVDARPHAVQAHAHYRARHVDAWAELPDGTRRPLLRISDWDPAWQERYEYATTPWLPAGTTIRLVYVFDNSADNPRNPDQPPRRAGWGWRTSDEMGDLWLQVFTRSTDDRDRLLLSARRKMQTEDAIGSERLIAREPGRTDLRNDAAAIYMAIDRPADALRHFAEATRLQPESAAAWFNEGVALEAMDRVSEALPRYDRAIELDPGYSAAHNNRGAILIRQGKPAAARRSYEAAVAADGRNAEAHANLALVLIGDGEPDASAAHVEAALALQPERAARLVQFVWLLAANADERHRRSAAAVRLADGIVTASGRRDPHALDALGIALAAAGRFDEARRAAEEALALPATAPAFAAEVRARLAGYRAGRAFVLQR